MEQNQTAVPMPMLGFQPAQEVEAQRIAKIESDAKAASMAAESIKPSLISYLENRRQEAVSAKETSGVVARLLEAQRRRKGEHSPEKKAQLSKSKLPDYWVPVTQTKCIHTEAWFRDLLMPYADKIWMLEPSVLPDLQDDEKEAIRVELAAETVNVMAGGEQLTPEEIREMHDEVMEKSYEETVAIAKERAKAMERLIQDQHEDCDFSTVFREFQSNLVTYGTAFLKGPFTVNKKRAKWVNGKRVVVNEIIPTCSSPSPFDIFPAPWARHEQEGYIIERIPTYREALIEVMDLPYYQKQQIRSLLAAPAQTGSFTVPGEETRKPNEDKVQHPPQEPPFDLWQWTGPLPGYMLTDWGIKGVEASEDYLVEVQWCQGYVVKVMPRWDETGVRPYFKAVFKPVLGSFWGVGVPHLMSSSQDRANAMMIALLFNTSWGSGSTGWIDMNMVVNPDDIRNWRPNQLIAIQRNPGQTGSPMDFAKVDLRVAELQSCYQVALNDADNESGVPAYMYGSGQAGAGGGTYAGLATLMNAAARGIKDALLEVDRVLSKFIQHWADWNNEYSDDESVKGDIRVQCSGATGLFVQEMQLSRMDDLIAQASKLVQLTGPQFVINMLRQKAKILRVSTEGLPSQEDLEKVPTVPPEQLGAMAAGDGGEQGMLPQSEAGGPLPAAQQPSMGVETEASNNMTPVE